MAGEVTTNSVILQSRLTAVNRLVDGDVPGARGVARFDIATSPDFAGSRTTEWLQAVPDHDFIVKQRVDQLKPGTQYHYRLVYGPDAKNVQKGTGTVLPDTCGADRRDEHELQQFLPGRPNRELGYNNVRIVRTPHI